MALTLLSDADTAFWLSHSRVPYPVGRVVTLANIETTAEVLQYLRAQFHAVVDYGKVSPSPAIWAALAQTIAKAHGTAALALKSAFPQAAFNEVFIAAKNADKAVAELRPKAPQTAASKAPPTLAPLLAADETDDPVYYPKESFFSKYKFPLILGALVLAGGLGKKKKRRGPSLAGLHGEG